MFFPLGLGFWPKGQAPWATILLVAVIVFVSIIEFGPVRRYDREITKASQDLKVNEKWFRVLERICEIEKADPDCGSVFNPKKNAAKNNIKTDMKKPIVKPLAKKKPATAPVAKTATSSAAKPATPPPKPAPKMNDIFKDVSKVIAKQQKLVRFLAKYKNPDRLPQKYKNLPEYKVFLTAKQDLETRLDRAAAENQLLTKRSLSFESVLKATATHANVMHLLGNMIFLVVFGAYVELAIGGPLVIIIFLLGSIVGLSAEVLTMPGNVTLMGASAGCMGLVGAYLVQYWRMPMKILVAIIPVYFRIVYIATPIVVPLFYVLGDFIGVLARSQHLDSVAHVAHLSGFAVGAGISLLIHKVSALPEPFLFEKEFELYAAFKNTSDLRAKLSLFFKIIDLNPFNELAMHQILEALKSNPEFAIASQDQMALTNNVNRLIRLKANKEKNQGLVLQLLDDAEGLPIAGLLYKLSWQSVMRFADLALRAKRLRLSLRLYRFILMQNDAKIDRIGLEKTCQAVENVLNSTPAI